jgi:hypothetical protein
MGVRAELRLTRHDASKKHRNALPELAAHFHMLTVFGSLKARPPRRAARRRSQRGNRLSRR